MEFFTRDFQKENEKKSLLARFDGDRHQVRQQAVRQALSGLLALLR